MSKTTKIQWCHSTVNPAMGCDGCELWPGTKKILRHLTQKTEDLSGSSSSNLTKTLSGVIGRRATSEIYADRNRIADALAARLNLGKPTRNALVDAIRKDCKCYAGLLGTMRAGHKGYADQFEQPKLFPGRMANAVRWTPPSPAENATKPWLKKAPRMIFISDMGDALSSGVSFDYLKQEIIDVVASEAGQQQLWLWLSKRPARMAEFGRWLLAKDVPWPPNLVAMTTVTSPASACRVAELRKVPSLLKGLSCEPVFAELNLDLTGIDWVIMGGGSDVLAEPFEVEWALNLREQSRKANAAFFLKQLGKAPRFQGQVLKLADPHGGDWQEWPVADWRTREIPEAFRTRHAISRT